MHVRENAELQHGSISFTFTLFGGIENRKDGLPVVWYCAEAGIVYDGWVV